MDSNSSKSIAHEVRTPLNAVVGAARILEFTKLDEKQKQIVQTLQQNAELLMQMIDKLLQGNTNPADYTAIINHSVGMSGVVPIPATNKILLVEDYQSNAMVASMMLENMGYEVEHVLSGEEALEAIEKASRPYSVILMDVQMSGINGFEATKQIRELEKKKGYRQLIIGVTAYAFAGDRERCLEADMDDYVSKPINPDILMQKVNKSASAA